MRPCRSMRWPIILGLPGSENHPGAAPALPGLRGRAARAARPTATRSGAGAAPRCALP